MDTNDAQANQLVEWHVFSHIAKILRGHSLYVTGSDATTRSQTVRQQQGYRREYSRLSHTQRKPDEWSIHSVYFCEGTNDVKRLCLLAALAASVTFAESYDAKMFAEMRWRSIGPHRGGRTRASAGVPGQPNVFYIGAVNGGVWKTNDYGRTWTPIFDDQPTGSIGAIAVAPSDPNIIYVGSGEGLQRPDLSVGDGIYKSTDAGKTWTHLGLRDGQQIPQIAVDPHDPNRLFVAVLAILTGRTRSAASSAPPTAAARSRRFFIRTRTPAARMWSWILHNRTRCTRHCGKRGKVRGRTARGAGPSGGIFKSSDGGKTWRPVDEGSARGRSGAGQHRDRGQQSEPSLRLDRHCERHVRSIARTMRARTGFARPLIRGRQCALAAATCPMSAVDPKNPDVIYSASTVTWKSTDGGKTWTGIRGAPGGDDYQKIWINPENPNILLIVSDQGAIITVNGGDTWSSWYNQPTAQMYHANADNAFPYRVCSGQQESGSACVASRGNDGEITFREWHPVGVKSTATPRPIRWIPTWFTAAN